MPEPDAERLNQILTRVLEHTATAEELRELEDRMLGQPAVQKQYLRTLELHRNLVERGTRAGFGVSSAPRPEALHGAPRVFKNWLHPIPIAAAICLGLFCASLLSGYEFRISGKKIPLLEESFEGQADPEVHGIPDVEGIWSGDFCDRVPVQGPVRPLSGGRMLRLLRADYTGKPADPPSRTSGLWRLVDIRPHKSFCADGQAEVHFCAHLNSQAFSEPLQYTAFVAVYALESADVLQKNHRDSRKLAFTALALNRGNWVLLDHTPLTWQRVDTTLRLPAETDFLLVQIALKQTALREIPIQFGNQYVDGIQLTLTPSSGRP